MNEPKVRDLLAADPFDDAFRNFLRPWVSRGVAQAPDIKVDFTKRNGDYKDDRVIRSERQYGYPRPAADLDLRPAACLHSGCALRGCWLPGT